jgi:hypothetical protein
MTYQMIYSSQANSAMTMSDLEAILIDARTGNEERNVTGVLVYVDRVFLQILEGEKETLLQLMRSIAADKRHSGVTVFYEAEVERPMFSNWRMAHIDARPDQMAAWAGLEGTARIEDIAQGIRRDPQRASRVIENILQTLAA